MKREQTLMLILRATNGRTNQIIVKMKMKKKMMNALWMLKYEATALN